jgi:hypothetical protein
MPGHGAVSRFDVVADGGPRSWHQGSKSWRWESGQSAKWIFCLIAAIVAAKQERL